MVKIIKQIKKIGSFSIILLGTVVLSSCEFAGSADRGVYKSMDGGEVFTQKVKINNKENFGGADALTLAVDKSAPNTLYVGTKNNGILRSTDGGENWTKDVNNFTNVSSIVINSQDSKEIYITATKNGVSKIFKTENGGDKWFEPFTQSTGRVQNWTVTLSPNNPAVVYAGDSNGGVYKSEDAGKSWCTLHWARNGIRKISVDPKNDNRIYFQIDRGQALKTEDGGKTFSEMATGRKVLNVQAHPRIEGSVYLIDENGLQKSNDAGATFTAIKTLVQPDKVAAIDLSIDPSNDQVMYFTTGNAFHKTVNGGATWRPIDLKFNQLITDIEINPSNSSIIYLAVSQVNDRKNPFLPSL